MFAAPDFLLLDEPTNNLDREGRDAVREAAARLARRRDHRQPRPRIARGNGRDRRTHRPRRARYGGGWSAYRARKEIEQAAIEAELAGAEKRVDAAQRQAQAATERQDRRDSGGRSKAARGGAPKILAWRDEAPRRGNTRRRKPPRRTPARRSRGQLSGRARPIEIVDPLSVGLPSTGLPASRTCSRSTMSPRAMSRTARHRKSVAHHHRSRTRRDHRSQWRGQVDPSRAHRRNACAVVGRCPRPVPSRSSISASACSTRRCRSPTISSRAIRGRRTTSAAPRSRASASAPTRPTASSAR
jgi:hypothetical protein